MQRLVRYDAELGVRAELNQKGIREAGHQLIEAIDVACATDPALANKLRPLREYALAGIEGRVISPRTWAQEPLRYEFKEDLLPTEILNAYGSFAFFTHGLSKTPSSIEYRNGEPFIAVDD
jgi:hypothetical protein